MSLCVLTSFVVKLYAQACGQFATLPSARGDSFDVAKYYYHLTTFMLLAAPRMERTQRDMARHRPRDGRPWSRCRLVATSSVAARRPSENGATEHMLDNAASTACTAATTSRASRI